jgi:hypothetical protein
LVLASWPLIDVPIELDHMNCTQIRHLEQLNKRKNNPNEIKLKTDEVTTLQEID